jgi:hypothetical protein
MTILKGGVDGFSCFSLISVILFSNQNHPCFNDKIDFHFRKTHQQKIQRKYAEEVGFN